jgi:hypothetical protein
MVSLSAFRIVSRSSTIKLLPIRPPAVPEHAVVNQIHDHYFLFPSRQLYELGVRWQIQDSTTAA